MLAKRKWFQNLYLECQIKRSWRSKFRWIFFHRTACCSTNFFLFLLDTSKPPAQNQKHRPSGSSTSSWANPRASRSSGRGKRCRATRCRRLTGWTTSSASTLCRRTQASRDNSRSSATTTTSRRWNRRRTTTKSCRSKLNRSRPAARRTAAPGSWRLQVRLEGRAAVDNFPLYSSPLPFFARRLPQREETTHRDDEEETVSNSWLRQPGARGCLLPTKTSQLLAPSTHHLTLLKNLFFVTFRPRWTFPALKILCANFLFLFGISFEKRKRNLLFRPDGSRRVGRVALHEKAM